MSIDSNGSLLTPPSEVVDAGRGAELRQGTKRNCGSCLDDDFFDTIDVLLSRKIDVWELKSYLFEGPATLFAATVNQRLPRSIGVDRAELLRLSRSQY